MIGHTYANNNGMYQSGLASVEMNQMYAHQRNTMWCWAACVQMIAHVYGLEVTQDELVAEKFGTDRYGNACNCPAYDEQLSDSLAMCASNLSYCIDGEMGHGFPNMNLLIHYLHNNVPVIITHDSAPGMKHAVLITSVTYEFKNGQYYLYEIVLRDPAPDLANRQRQGKKVIGIYQMKSFLASVRTHWYVDVIQSSEYNGGFQDLACIGSEGLDCFFA